MKKDIIAKKDKRRKTLLLVVAFAISAVMVLGMIVPLLIGIFS